MGIKNPFGLETDKEDNKEKRQLLVDASLGKKTCGCNAHVAMMKCNKQINTHWSRRTRKVSEASVSGRYNSPPLTRDLAPRSMDENGREVEEVKLSCFFDKRVKPRALRG